jgi:MFS family permease
MFGVVGHRLPRRTLFVVSFLLCGGPRMLIFAAEPPLWACLTTVAVAGLAAGSINPIIGTVQLERTPPGMRARVFGCMGAGAWAAMPIGALVAGMTVEHLGLTPTLLVLGSAYILVVLSPLLGGPWAAHGATGTIGAFRPRARPGGRARLARPYRTRSVPASPASCGG